MNEGLQKMFEVLGDLNLAPPILKYVERKLDDWFVSNRTERWDAEMIWNEIHVIEENLIIAVAK